MRAKEFERIAANTLRPPTDRKVVNLARRLGLRDTWSEVYHYTGLNRTKMSEFITD